MLFIQIQTMKMEKGNPRSCDVMGTYNNLFFVRVQMLYIMREESTCVDTKQHIATTFSIPQRTIKFFVFLVVFVYHHISSLL